MDVRRPRVDGIEAARRLLGPQGPRSHQRRLGTLQLKGVVAAPSEYSAMPILHRPGDRGRLHGGGPLADVGGGRLADHGDALRLLGMRERVERPCSPRRSPSEPGRSARPRQCTDSSPNRKITWPVWRTWSCIPPPGPRTRPATWRTSTSPSRGAAATLHTGSSRLSMHSPTGFGLLAHPGVQRPGTLPMRHPRPSDIVRRIPSAEFAGRFRAVRPTPAAARGRSAALRRGRDRGVRRLPQLHLSTPQHESQPTAESS